MYYDNQYYDNQSIQCQQQMYHLQSNNGVL